MAFVWQVQYTEPSGGAFVWQTQDTEPSGGAGACVGAAGPQLAFMWQAQYTQSLLEELVRTWAPLGRGWLSCGRRSTQSLRWAAAGFRVARAVHRAFAGPRLAFVWQEQYTRAFWRSWRVRGRRWAASGFCVADGLSWERRSTQSLAEELWAGSHTIFDTPSFTHNFVTHHLWHTIFHTIFDTPSFTPLCHTPSFTHHFVTHHFVTHQLSHHFVTHYLSHTALSHTIFHTHTHNFVTPSLSHTTCHTPSLTPLCHTPSFTHHLSHTIFVTPLCHTPSFTHHLSHHFVTHHLSHTILDTPSLTHHLSHHFVPHHLSHTTLSHTIFHTPLCHTPSFTLHLWHTIFYTPSFIHHLWHHIFDTHHLSHTVTDHLSHTIFHTPLCRTQLCHTPSFLHLLLCFSFLPRPRYNISCWLLEEVGLWGYPVLLFFYFFCKGLVCLLSLGNLKWQTHDITKQDLQTHDKTQRPNNNNNKLPNLSLARSLLLGQEKYPKRPRSCMSCCEWPRHWQVWPIRRCDELVFFWWEHVQEPQGRGIPSGLLAAGWEIPGYGDTWRFIATIIEANAGISIAMFGYQRVVEQWGLLQAGGSSKH